MKTIILIFSILFSTRIYSQDSYLGIDFKEAQKELPTTRIGENLSGGLKTLSSKTKYGENILIFNDERKCTLQILKPYDFQSSAIIISILNGKYERKESVWLTNAFKVQYLERQNIFVFDKN